MNKYIVINGSNGSGKDTFVEFCLDYIHSTYDNIEVHNISTIDPVKNVAKVFGWDGIKDNKSRMFLVELKQAWVKYNDGSLQYIQTYANNTSKEVDNIIFIHCREPEEIDKIKNRFNAKTLLVVRDKIEIANNSSDLNVNNYIYDTTIANYLTLDHLNYLAGIFCNNLILNK